MFQYNDPVIWKILELFSSSINREIDHRQPLGSLSSQHHSTKRTKALKGNKVPKGIMYNTTLNKAEGAHTSALNSQSAT